MKETKDSKELVAQFDAIADNSALKEFDANLAEESNILAGKAAPITINIYCPKKAQ